MTRPTEIHAGRCRNSSNGRLVYIELGIDYASDLVIIPAGSWFKERAMIVEVRPPRQFKREDLKPGENLCTYCTGKCCRYFALPIETPTTRKDFDHMRWYMLHGRVSFFVDQGTWFLMVHNDCRELMPDNRCGIYQTRPQICRTYTTDNCEYDDKTCYDQFFETPEQIEEYADLVLNWGKKKKKEAEKSGVVSLPVV